MPCSRDSAIAASLKICKYKLLARLEIAGIQGRVVGLEYFLWGLHRNPPPPGTVGLASRYFSMPRLPLNPNNRLALPPKTFSLSSSDSPGIDLIVCTVLGHVATASP